MRNETKTEINIIVVDYVVIFGFLYKSVASNDNNNICNISWEWLALNIKRREAEAYTSTL